MAISTVAAYLPAAQETAEAASWTYHFYGYYTGFSTENTKLSQFSSFFVVEKGNKELYLRDAIGGYRSNGSEYESFYGSKLDGVKFVSKNTDILTVDSKTGKINAKKTGTALVKITWKKQTLYGAIKVISSSDMKAYKTEYKTTISYAKKILKACGDKLTTAGALKAQKLYLQMVSDEGYNLTVYNSEGSYDEDGNYSYTSENIVYSMDAFNAKLKMNELYSYMDDKNPLSTTGSNTFKISSLSGSGKTVTATLSKAVTEDQMAAAQYFSYDASKIGGTSYSFDIYLMDTKTDEFVKGTATIKTGSKTIKIKTESSLTKGRKYELMTRNWTYWDYSTWSEETAAYYLNDWTRNGTYIFKAK